MSYTRRLFLKVLGWSGAALAFLPIPLALRLHRRVRAGAAGLDLLPVLQGAGQLSLAYGCLLGLGLALGAH